MATDDRRDIDEVLRDWKYEPGVISARLAETRDGREVIQMRIDLGILQMETTARPDGRRIESYESYFDYLLEKRIHEGDRFGLKGERCEEIDRELAQFYQRRICNLALRRFPEAIEDADHWLALIDFMEENTEDRHWVVSHQQFRPLAIFHRTQAAALLTIERSSPAEAIEEIDGGLKLFREFFERHEATEHFDEDPLVEQLEEMKESFREEYGVGQTLSEQLAEAIDMEDYELAAKIRDQMSRKPGLHRQL